ncbi:MAG: hypothetical protein KBG15_06915 [Kofleriaceae bacterium]|nr:hypothetical protein [Kofleriaceae bacterium]
MNKRVTLGVGLMLVVAQGCGASTPRPVAAPATEESAHGEPYLVEGDIGYAMCGMQMVSGDGMDASASKFFGAAQTAHSANDLAGAATQYMAGADALVRSAQAHDPTVIYNRRVAYANAVNLWLSKHDTEAARVALLGAAPNDADLAAELQFAADALPQPMRCTAAKVPATAATVRHP